VLRQRNSDRHAIEIKVLGVEISFAFKRLTCQQKLHRPTLNYDSLLPNLFISVLS
jgi:hypothetical protein